MWHVSLSMVFLALLFKQVSRLESIVKILKRFGDQSYKNAFKYQIVYILSIKSEGK